jgi:hypothetical protein
MGDKSNNSLPQTTARKTYQKPTLAKAAVLSAVTAQSSTSSSSDSQNAACWVARAAFGETDIRWMIFRAWLLEDAPAWFRRLYVRHGASIGYWLAGRDSARLVVRALMMPVVNSKLRQATQFGE